MRQIALGFLSLFHMCDRFWNLPFSLFSAKNETCSSDISPDRFDMFVETRCKYHKGCRGASDVSSNQKRCVNCVQRSCEHEPLFNR